MSKSILYLDLSPGAILVLGDSAEQIMVTVQEKKGRKTRLKVEAPQSRAIFTITTQDKQPGA